MSEDMEMRRLRVTQAGDSQPQRGAIAGHILRCKKSTSLPKLWSEF